MKCINGTADCAVIYFYNILPLSIACIPHLDNLHYLGNVVWPVINQWLKANINSCQKTKNAVKKLPLVFKTL